MTDAPQDSLHEKPAYKHSYQNPEDKNIAKGRHTIQKNTARHPVPQAQTKPQDPIMQIIKVQITTQNCPGDPVIPIMPNISGLQLADKNSLEM